VPEHGTEFDGLARFQSDACAHGRRPDIAALNPRWK
jgi:hypothetical protein